MHAEVPDLYPEYSHTKRHIFFNDLSTLSPVFMFCDLTLIKGSLPPHTQKKRGQDLKSIVNINMFPKNMFLYMQHGERVVTCEHGTR